MKKILMFFVAVVISAVTFGQVKSNMLTMPDLTTTFPIALPAYSTVTVESNSKVYLVTSYYTTAQTMTHVLADVNFVDLTLGGLWTQSGGDLYPTTATDNVWAKAGLTVNDAALIKEALTVGSDADNHDGTINLIASDGDAGSFAINTSDVLLVSGFDNISFLAARVNMGGSGNAVTGNYTMAGGQWAVADKYGQFTRASNRFTSAGDAQTSLLVARNSVTHSDANWYSLYLDGTSILATISASTVWSFRVMIVGTNDAQSETFSYEIVGQIKRDAANNTTLMASSVTTIFETDSDFDARVTADDTNEALLVEVTDATSGSSVIRWVARVELTEVGF